MERYTASIINDGILIHGSMSNIPIRKGMFIVFDNDFLSFRIDDFDNYKIEKNFKSLEGSNKIHVFENSLDFIENDYVDIYFDEYEFFGYTKIIEKNGNFFKNQKFSLEKKSDTEDGDTLLEITEINEDGSLDLKVIKKGIYKEIPEENLYFISEDGSKILIDYFYRKISNKNFQSNLIKDIIYKDDFVVITLINDLPKNVKNGKLITNKYLIKTNANLSELKKHKEFFYIINNKLPYLNLPYPDIEDEVAAKMLEDIFFKIDNKLAILEQEIKKLSK